MNARRSRRGGFAMLVALMVVALLTLVAIFALNNAGEDRQRAVRHVRSETRESCALGGLGYARRFFASQFTNWNTTFFTNPATYNPIYAGGAPVANLANLAALQTTNPELFVDLDGDARADVYVFIRDNYDEFPPAVADFQTDNDTNAIVGALCISQTMVPRRADRSIDPDQLMVESLLSVNVGGGYGVGTGGNYNN